MEDGLTHLYHAGAFKGLVERKLAKMKDGQLGAFWIMDLENFKEFNDQYGHQTGDEILRQFAHLLERSLRGDGIMARIGGDEFAAYLDVVENQEEILALCGRMRDAFLDRQIGTSQTVLLEEGKNGLTGGYTDRYLYVVLENPGRLTPGEVVSVRITGRHGAELIGTL